MPLAFGGQFLETFACGVPAAAQRAEALADVPDESGFDGAWFFSFGQAAFCDSGEHLWLVEGLAVGPLQQNLSNVAG